MKRRILLLTMTTLLALTGLAWADDAAVLQTALNNAVSGGIIQLEPRTYDLGSTTIYINGYANLVGAGRGATVIKYVGPGTAIQVNQGTGVGTHGWRIADLTITGDYTGANGVQIGTEIINDQMSAGGAVERVEIQQFTGRGLNLAASQISFFKDCYFSDNGVGLYIYNAGGNNINNNFQNCSFERNTGAGAYVRQSVDLTFACCQFLNNGQEGILFERPDSATVCTRLIKLTSCYFVANNRNRTGTGWAEAKFCNLGTSLIFDVQIKSCYFSAVSSGNRAVSCGRGFFRLKNNESVSPNQVYETANTCVSYVDIEDQLNPATSMVAGAGSLVSYRLLSGTGQLYKNASGTMTPVTPIN